MQLYVLSYPKFVDILIIYVCMYYIKFNSLTDIENT